VPLRAAVIKVYTFVIIDDTPSEGSRVAEVRRGDRRRGLDAAEPAKGMLWLDLPELGA
jgi:hypothetical protein